MQLNHWTNLPKWLSVCLRTKWWWVRVPLLSLKNYRYQAYFEGSFFKGGSIWQKKKNSQKNFSYLLNDLRKLNEIFWEDVTYDNIKSHKKQELHLDFRRYIFRKTAGELNLRFFHLWIVWKGQDLFGLFTT